MNKRHILPAILASIAMLLYVMSLFAASPVRSTYDNPVDVRDEFINAYDELQAKKFRILVSTPQVNDLFEGEMVLVSSTSKSIYTRFGQTLFSVRLSSG